MRLDYQLQDLEPFQTISMNTRFGTVVADASLALAYQLSSKQKKPFYETLLSTPNLFSSRINRQVSTRVTQWLLAAKNTGHKKISNSPYVGWTKLLETRYRCLVKAHLPTLSRFLEIKE